MTIQSEIQALKCADCARSDSAVSDLRPDSLLPFPADALSGWRDGKPGTAGVTRRKLLRNGVLARLLTERPQLKYLMLHNIDTLGADVDPALLGLHIESGACLTFEVITKRIEDRGGGLAR